MNRLLAVAVAASIVIGACALERVSTPVPEYRVAGVVTAGPFCPVATDPPDPACADRPVSSARLFILDEAGNEFSEVSTDADGFEIALPAGLYTLQPRPVEGLIGTAEPQTFEAGPGITIELTFGYDTGIR